MAEVNNVHYETALKRLNQKKGISITSEVELVQARAELAIAHELRTQTLVLLLKETVAEENRTTLLEEIFERLYG